MDAERPDQPGDQGQGDVEGFVGADQVQRRVDTVGGELADPLQQAVAVGDRLRAELGSVKDRLAVVERIVTDESHRVASEIEALRRPAN